MSFISKSCYKSLYIFNTTKLRSLLNARIYTNSCSIPYVFSRFGFSLYNGKRWKTKYLRKYACGHKFGEFVWTRKIAIFKKNQKLKKKKKK